jgi:N-alpha-acetyl-L-2,4-diaminobutyrate deacetylase
VDYLLDHAQVVAVLWAEWPERLECRWAEVLRGWPEAEVPALGFGASDCRCQGHLIRLTGEPDLDEMSAALAEVCHGIVVRKLGTGGWKEMLELQPDYIRITHGGQRVSLPHYRLGRGQQRVLIMAGVHGREHGGVQAAYQLVERLAGIPLDGQVDVLPVCNPPAYAAESRFTPESNRDMERAFVSRQPNDLAEALAHAVLALAREAQVVLNLHTAGYARYLPHAIFYRDQDVEWASALGFPFVIKRIGSKSPVNTIFAHMGPGQRAVTLELGGGVVAFPEDVNLGIDRILALLGRMGFLGPGEFERSPTPPEMVWLTDARLFVRAPGEGAFYARASLGADLVQGQPFGFWVGLDDLRPHPVLAPTTGKLIYLRTRNRVRQGETLAMFLPHQHISREEER